MALDRRRLIKVFKEESQKIESENTKIKDYHDELYKAVTDIIYQESLHQEKATRIQQKINDIISVLGDYVAQESDN